MTERTASKPEQRKWRTDIESAPKDGSDVLFPIEFVGRAYWCNDLKRWVLTYSLRIEFVSHPTAKPCGRCSRCGLWPEPKDPCADMACPAGTKP